MIHEGMIRKMQSVFVYAIVLSALAMVVLAVPALAQSGETLKAAMATNPPTLDPHISTTTACRQLAFYIGESLAVMDEEYKIIPQLAESWEVSENGLIYTFHLRSGVKFHNGKVLTAPDVEASLERYMNISPGKTYFKTVESIEVVDPLTIVIHQTEPAALEIGFALPNPCMVVFPEEIVRGKTEGLRGPNELVGTGPYKLVEWIPDVHILLERFEDYTNDARYDGPTGLGGNRTATFAQIEFVPVTEAASRLAGLETGEYDFAEDLPPTSYSRLEADPDVDLHVAWSSMVNLEINKAVWPTSDVRFRQAVAAALNMEQIMKAVTFGNDNLYELQPSLFPPQQTLWHNLEGADVYNHQDLDKVQRLLEEVGYNNEEIVYITNRDYPFHYKASIAAAAQLQAAGINVQLEFMDWPSQMQRAISLENWHLHQCSWSMRVDPLMLASSFSSGSAVAFGYNNSKMDELMKKIGLSLPPDERRGILLEVQKLQWEDLPIINYGGYLALEATSSRVKGYKPWYVMPRFWMCTI